jgi:hypothetical protein
LSSDALPVQCSKALLGVLGAHGLEQLRIRPQLGADGHLDRPRVHHRICHRHFDVHVADVAAVVPFGHTQRLGVRVTGAVQPRLVIETGALDDETLQIHIAIATRPSTPQLLQ